ncbi:MAG: DUF2231 domain-containing protein [Methylococcales bacterium]
MKELFFEYFPGIGHMANIHPLLVHFPIALLTGFILAELLSLVSGNEDLQIAGRWMLYFGTLGALAAAIVGLQSAESVFHEGEVHAEMTKHRDYGLNVVALSMVLCLWRLLEGRDLFGWSRVIQSAISILMFVNLLFGADIGGNMVYHHGVAVEAVVREESPEESHEHGESIGSEIMEWLNGLIHEAQAIREHTH